MPDPTDPRPRKSTWHQLRDRAERLYVTVGFQTSVLLGLVALVAVALAVTDLDAGLAHLDNTVLSGPEQGHYFHETESMRALAESQGGTLHNVSTAGSAENAERLVAAHETCDAHFALVQDGTVWPDTAAITLLGRLPRSESLFLLGRDADRIRRFSDLRGLRLGIGPKGSGTAQIARRIFGSPELAELEVALEPMPLATQLDALQRGELPLGAFVIDEDAALIAEAVTQRGLQLADLEHLDVIARKLDFAWLGRIGAGQYDPIRVLPPSDRHVLRIDTLVVANACPSASEKVALMRLLAERDPELVVRNRDQPNRTGILLDPVAATFYAEGGPGFVDRYFPWAVDVMPVSNWVYVAMALSLLFNLMGAGHRFRLWRLDANRVASEDKIAVVLGTPFSSEELALAEPTEAQRQDATREKLLLVAASLRKLRARCRRFATSMLVPMGAEMAYRYQEHAIDRTVDALALFLDRWPPAQG